MFDQHCQPTIGVRRRRVVGEQPVLRCRQPRQLGAQLSLIGEWNVVCDHAPDDRLPLLVLEVALTSADLHQFGA